MSLISLHFAKSSKFNLLLAGGAVTTAGLIVAAIAALQLPNSISRYSMLGLIVLLIGLNAFLAYYVIQQIYKPIHILIRETAEAIQGLRQGDISARGIANPAGVRA
jgi:hypothetical protein